MNILVFDWIVAFGVVLGIGVFVDWVVAFWDVSTAARGRRQLRSLLSFFALVQLSVVGFNCFLGFHLIQLLLL